MMKDVGNRWLVGATMVVSLHLAACGRQTAPPDSIEPAHVEHIEGTEVSRVILTDKAVERVGVQLGTVEERRVVPAGQQRKVVPYSAVIYGVHGDTWVYTSPERNTYVRAPIEIEHIDGSVAVLISGPAVGTTVVTVGGGVLHGTEFEVGH